MRKIRVTRSFIPNMFTLMNLFGGFLAITRIAEGDFMRATGFIILSALFDVLDGAVARMTKSTSEFGVELDSLCDAVSFGVVPSFMLYKAYFYQASEWGLVLSALPAMAGVLRLARFNIQATGDGDKRYFRGMPIPAGALTILSYVLFYHTGIASSEAGALLPTEWKPFAIVAVTLMVAGIMVSTIKYDAMPLPTPRIIKERPFVIAFFAVGIVISIVSKGVLVFPFMLLYISVGVVRSTVNFFRNRNAIEVEQEEEDTNEEEEPDPFDV